MGKLVCPCFSMGRTGKLTLAHATHHLICHEALDDCP